jgi:hypothetical protein
MRRRRGCVLGVGRLAGRDWPQRLMPLRAKRGWLAVRLPWVPVRAPAKGTAIEQLHIAAHLFPSALEACIPPCDAATLLADRDSDTPAARAPPLPLTARHRKGDWTLTRPPSPRPPPRPDARRGLTMAHIFDVGTRAWQPDTAEGWVASEVTDKQVAGDKVTLVFTLENGEVGPHELTPPASAGDGRG